MKEVLANKEIDKPQKESQGGFLSGSGLAFFWGLLLTAIGFTLRLDPFGFWNIVIIALALPLVAGFLSFKWKRSGKIAMAKGAMIILLIGCIVTVGVTIWFISVLSSLGN